jgi:Starch-binding associating with outer membrane
MKNNISNYIIGSVITALLLGGAVGCKKEGKYFTKDINQDPSQLVTAPPNVLLAPAELAIAYVQNGDFSRYSGVFTQQYTGAYRQFASYNMYSFSSSDFGSSWNTMYTTGMGNLNQVIKISTEKGYKNYAGVGKVLMAYSLALCSDMWGDIPYSDAFKGLDQIQPKYDSQKDIYAAALKLCDDAIADMALKGTAAGGVVPGAEDLIYGGDMANWTLFAHALKARLYLHQSKFDLTARTKGLAEIAAAAGFTDAAVPFTGASYGNPWYQYESERADITFIGSAAFTLMKTKGDSRIDALIDTVADAPGAYIADAAAPVYFINAAELGFISAELNQRNGASAAAAIDYTEAVKASFVLMGRDTTEANAYLGANSYATATNKLKAIMEEKYIALYGSPEAYTDWRRTGFPVLAPNDGNAIPRRFLYPDSEEQYNNANMSAGTTNNLLAKVWWDQ